MTKTTGGAVTLSGANTYTGTTLVSAGTLQLAGGSAIADTGAVSIANVSGAILDLGNSSEVIGSLAGGGGAGGAVTLGSGTLTTGDASSTAFDGVISGTGNITKQGAGTFTLSGTNTYTGTTTVNTGTLALGASNVLADTSSLSVNGGTFAIAGNSDTVNAVTLTSGSITGSGGVLSSTTDIDARAGGISAILGGSAGLTKTTAGTVILSGANTYTGTTSVNAGSLQLSGGSAIADAGAVSIADVSGAILDLNNTNETIGSIAGGGATGGQVTLGSATMTTGNAASTVFAGVVSGTGGLTKQGAGTFTLSGANTYTGLTTVNAGTLRLSGGAAIADTGAVSIANAATAVLDLNNAAETIGSLAGGGGSGGAVTLGSGTLTTGDGSNTTFAGIISGTGGLTKQGGGIFTLSGANTHSGATTINAGTLQLSGGSAIADTGAVSIANVSGAILDLNGTAETIGSLAGGGGTGGAVALGGGALTTGDTTDTTFAGVIGGAGTLTKQGTGKFTVSGVNIYTGLTTVNAGTLAVTNAAGLGTTAAGTTVASGGTLQLAGVAVGAEAIGISGTGAGGTGALLGSGASSLAGPVSLNGGATIGVTNGSALTLTGAVTGAQALTVTAGTGAIDFQAAIGTIGTPLSNFTVTSAGQIDLANVFANDIAVTATGIDLNGTTYTAATDDIRFTGTVDLDNGGTIALSTAGGAGDVIQFDGAVSGGSALALSSADTVTINGDVSATSISIQNVTTAVVLGANADLTAQAGTLEIWNGVTAIQLSGAAGTTNIIDGNGDALVRLAAITGSNNANLTINSEGDLTLDTVSLAGGAFAATVDNNATGINTLFANSISANAVTLSGGGGNDIIDVGSITTNGSDLVFNNPVILTRNTSYSTGLSGGNIQFNSTVNDDAGASDWLLSLTAGTGNVSFGSTVGNTTALRGLTVSSANTVTTAGTMALDAQGLDVTAAAITLGGNITTANSTAALRGAVTLTGNVTIDTIGSTGGDILFTSTVNTGGNILTVDAGAAGNITLSGNTSGGGSLIAVDGATQSYAGVTVGTFTIQDATTAVNLTGTVAVTGAASITSGGTINQTGAVTGATNLSYTASGAITQSGAISGVGNLTYLGGATIGINNSISTSGTVEIDSTGVTTIAAAGDISAGGNVAIGANRTGTLTTGGDITTTNDTVRLYRDVTLSGPVSVDTGGAAIRFDGAVASGAKSLTLNAGATGDITLTGAFTGGGNLTAVDGNAQSYAALTVGALTIQDATASVTFGGAVSAASNVSVTSDGTIGVNNAVTAGGTVSLDSAGTTTIAASGDINAGGVVTFGATKAGGLSTAGDIVTSDDAVFFNNAVTLSGPVDIDTGTAGGDIRFASTINTALATNSLSLDAGSAGDITITGALTGGGDLTVRDGNVQQYAAMTIGALSVLDATTGVTFGGDISATGAIGVNSGGSITQSGAVTNATNLAYTAGSFIAVSNAVNVGGTVNMDSGLTTSLAAAGDITAGGIVTFGLTGAGKLSTAGDIDTANANVRFVRAVTLDGAVDIDTGTTGGDITFSATIDSAANTLSLDAGTAGAIVLNGALSGGGDLTVRDGNTQSYVALGVANLNILEATTSVTFNGNVAATGAVSVTSGGTINLNNSITSAGTVTIDSAGITTLASGGDILSGGDVSFGATRSGALVSAADIRTSDDAVSFNRAVTLTGGVDVDTGSTGGHINFASTVATGGNTLNLDAGTSGNITISGALSGGGDLTVVDGNTQQYAALTVGALNIQDASSSVTFGGDIAAASSVTANSGGSIVQNGAVTSTTALSYTAGSTIGVNNAITASGPVSMDAVGTTTIAALGNISAGDAVTFGATRSGVLVTAGDILTSNDVVTFTRGVTLTDAVDIDSGATGADIRFDSTVATAGFALSLDAGSTGDITVGGAMTGGGNLTVRDADVQQYNSLTVGALSILNAATSVTFGGNIAATGTIGVASAGSISQNAAVTSGAALAYTAGTTIGVSNPITVSGPVSMDSTGLTTLTSTADISAGGLVTFGGTGVGQLFTAGDILTADGTVTFNRAVNLSGNVGIDTTGLAAGDILFNAAIASGGNALTLDAGPVGNIALGGVLSGGGNLTVVDGSVQNYATMTVGAFTIQDATTSVTLNGNITASGAISLASGGTIRQIGTVTQGASLNYSANTGAVDVDNAIQQISGNVTIASAGSNVNITNNALIQITGGGSANLQAGGGALTMQNGTSVTATSGSISLIAGGGNLTLSTVTTNSGSVGITSAGLIIDADGGAGSDVVAPSGTLTLASAGAIGGIETQVAAINGSTSGAGDVVITESDALNLNFSTAAGDLTVNTVSGALTLGTVNTPGRATNLNIVGAINGGSFNGNSANITAHTVGLGSVTLANTSTLKMTLSQAPGGSSGDLDRGAALVTPPPKADIIAPGTVRIGSLYYLPTEEDVAGVLSSLSTLSTEQEKIEELLSRTTAAEFFMTAPLEIYIDLQDEEEDDELKKKKKGKKEETQEKESLEQTF
ncbi:MAG: autotransporter-associated beta strand repeat-containing protein [Pseudomonadota bacterium]